MQNSHTRRDLRASAGVGLGISLIVIILTGFFATSGRDVGLVFFGFAAGLVTVYLVERLRASRAR